ncbi:hypothetical protein GCK32_015148 [Trichostrongylus colubriformis]|uniref:Uncharacterized protein n=1 Tax=Trichostrongylus colubriformis TaxID=6319 RepID=A0AAN8J1T8_TRICO
MAKEILLVLIIAAASPVTSRASSIQYLPKGLSMALNQSPANYDYEGCLDNIFDNAQESEAILKYAESDVFRASETFVLCVRDFFGEYCGAQTGWVQCEKERIGFAYDCPGLACRIMRTVLLSTLFVTGVVAFDGPLPVFSELKLSERVVKQAFFSPSKDDLYDACNSNLFNEAQAKFNSELGISADLTWRNASSLNYAVNKVINQGVDGLIKVCNARRDYAGVLLSSYPFCVNRFYLLEQGNTDFNNAVTYVHLYKHLEFMCSTGFDGKS